MAKNHRIKNIICYVLTGSTIIGGSGALINYILEKDNNEYNGNSIQTNIVDSTDYNTDYTDIFEESNETYDSLLSSYLKVLNSKQIDEDIKNLAVELFNNIYNNYDNFYKIFEINGALTKEEFIQKNIIDNLNDNFNSLVCKKNEDDLDSSFVAMYFSSDKKLIIDKDNFSVVDFAHEVSHGTEQDMTMENFIQYNILSEGNAVFNQQMARNDFSVNDLTIYNYNGNIYALRGVYMNDTEYTIYSKCYGSLCTICDFKVVEQAKKNGNFDCICDYLSSNYGIDGKIFTDSLEKLVESYENGNETNICKNLIQIEDTVNYCLNKRIESVDNKEDLMKLFNLRRYYNMQYATKELVNYENEYSFELSEKNNLDEYDVDNKLYEKCMEYNLLNIHYDDETNNKIFNFLVGQSSNNNSMYSYNQPLCLDNTLSCLSSDGMYYTLLDLDNNPIIQYNLETNEININDFDIRSDKIDGNTVLTVGYNEKRY